MSHLEYFQMADPDTLQIAQNIMDNQRDIELYAAELTYFDLHNAVPDWAVILDYVLEGDDGYVFVCQDWTQRN